MPAQNRDAMNISALCCVAAAVAVVVDDDNDDVDVVQPAIEET